MPFFCVILSCLKPLYSYKFFTCCSLGSPDACCFLTLGDTILGKLAEIKKRRTDHVIGTVATPRIGHYL